MQIDVYDTHILTNDGQQLHFDVLVKTEHGHQAPHYARHWLSLHQVHVKQIQQQSCQYCHSEQANPEIIHQIEQSGYYILPLKGFPVTNQQKD